MADQKSNLNQVFKEGKLKTYFFIAIVLLVVAVVILLISPKGDSLGTCLGIILPTNKYACIDRLALSTKNASLCSYLPSSNADSCYNKLAQATLNPQLCNNTTYRSSFNQCILSLARSTDSYKLCTLLDRENASSCLTTFAVNSYNISICSAITDNIDSEICTSSVNFRSALHLNSPKLCKNVTNSTNSTITQEITQYSNATANFSAGFLENMNYFELMQNVSFSSRDVCYTKFASISNNNSYCANIKNATLYDICNYSAYAGTPAQTLNLSSVNYTQLISSCYQAGSFNETCKTFLLLGEAVEERNVTICNEITPDLKYQCIISLATTYNDTSYCSYISNTTLNSACVADVGYSMSSGAS